MYIQICMYIYAHIPKVGEKKRRKEKRNKKYMEQIETREMVHLKK